MKIVPSHINLTANFIHASHYGYKAPWIWFKKKIQVRILDACHLAERKDIRDLGGDSDDTTYPYERSALNRKKIDRVFWRKIWKIRFKSKRTVISLLSSFFNIIQNNIYIDSLYER